MKDRIRALESQLSARAAQPPPAAVSEVQPIDDPLDERALERALQRRGAAVLSRGVVEITPAISWTHSGRDARTTVDDQVGASLDARASFADGWMVGANVPFAYRNVDGRGSNAGLGDVSLAIWKSLLRETQNRPAIVGSVRYLAPTGEDIGSDDVPIGAGFHRFAGRLSLLKTVDPIAFYGDVSYTVHVGERVRHFDVDGGPIYGFSLGSSLAVTPDVSTSVGLDFTFEREPRVNGVGIGGRTTAGAVDIGIAALLSRNLFLNVGARVGITDDSPDFTLAASLPYRF